MEYNQTTRLPTKTYTRLLTRVLIPISSHTRTFGLFWTRKLGRRGADRGYFEPNSWPQRVWKTCLDPQFTLLCVASRTTSPPGTGYYLLQEIFVYGSPLLRLSLDACLDLMSHQRIFFFFFFMVGLFITKKKEELRYTGFVLSVI